ncbi:unnamed protein product [marine sediment metagenome]|uniref:Uncharacterized protein n=1 Tax=marine sediment metagenome TaxID=412755 RepID=X1CVQ7_9ZZZZ
MSEELKLTDSEIVHLGSDSFSKYIKTMSKEELIGLLNFIYGYKLKND